MTTTRRESKRPGVLAVLALAGITAACSTVSPDELDTGLANLRAEMMDEMQGGDDAVSTDLGNRIDGVERRMAALESDLQQMERDFEVAIQQLEEELRFNVPVYFAFDDATVEAEDQAVLDRFGNVAQRYYPDALITVEGFTDPAGSEEYNLALGMRRATAVAEYLVRTTAMVEERVKPVSYGEDSRRLVATGDWGPGAPGWQNRRVVLVVDHDGEPPAMAPTISGGVGEGEGN